MFRRKKKVVFEDYEDNYANLKIRLRHDRIRQSEFFSFLVAKYTSCDPSFMLMIEDLKISLARVGKKRIKVASDDIKEGETLLEKLGISEADKEDLFDLIEKEYKDF
jgi:hypothetical protein